MFFKKEIRRTFCLQQSTRFLFCQWSQLVTISRLPIGVRGVGEKQDNTESSVLVIMSISLEGYS